ncbi:MAG: MCE family protein [Pseudomonadales bacterium]|nr:MCE family protein [Halioglobus sp.]MCP5122670.1 MCE family protein [Pseudomonadales bacterium]MCP5191840.1 MCE family protein [Pseudomonadales bacterium]
MSSKPHTVAIGAFVFGAILIAITIVIFALGSGFGQQREKVVMVFDGSVKGLVIGAPVTLRGVQIGQVTNLELMLDADTIELIMVVEAEISEKNIRRLGSNPEKVTDDLIARGMRAQLKTQSLLTGLLYIQLDFHPDKPAVFVDLKSEHVQIPTIPTDLELLTRQIEDIDLARLAGKLQGIINGLNTLATSESFQTLPARLQDSLASVTALSDELRTQVAASGPKLDKVLDGAAVTVAGANTELPKLSSLVEGNLKVLNGAIAAFEQTMTNVDSLVAPGSATAYQLNKALRELTLASRAIQELANLLDRQPESLLRGKQEDPQ